MINPCSTWLWVEGGCWAGVGEGAGRTGAPTCCSGSSLSCIRTCFWEGDEVMMRRKDGRWKEGTYWMQESCDRSHILYKTSAQWSVGDILFRFSLHFFFFYHIWWNRWSTLLKGCSRFKPTLLFSSCLAACLHGGCQIEEPEDQKNNKVSSQNLVTSHVHLQCWYLLFGWSVQLFVFHLNIKVNIYILQSTNVLKMIRIMIFQSVWNHYCVKFSAL